MGKTKGYAYLDKVMAVGKPFAVIRVDKLFRIPKESFDSWVKQLKSGGFLNEVCGITVLMAEFPMPSLSAKPGTFWDHEKGFLMDTCLTAQDLFKAYLDYFRIAY